MRWFNPRRTYKSRDINGVASIQYAEMLYLLDQRAQDLPDYKPPVCGLTLALTPAMLGLLLEKYPEVFSNCPYIPWEETSEEGKMAQAALLRDLATPGHPSHAFVDWWDNLRKGYGLPAPEVDPTPADLDKYTPAAQLATTPTHTPTQEQKDGTTP
jgi:hypothetical protein